MQTGNYTAPWPTVRETQRKVELKSGNTYRTPKGPLDYTLHIYTSLPQYLQKGTLATFNYFLLCFQLKTGSRASFGQFSFQVNFDFENHTVESSWKTLCKM